MMLGQVFRRLTAVSALAAFAVPALADSPKGGQQGQDKSPNVLVVKVKLDKDGNQTSDEASMYPMTMEIKRTAQDTIDFDQMKKDCDKTIQTAQAIPLKQDQAVDDSKVPDAVRQVFQDADQAQVTERTHWRIWSPWGSYANRGFYGYGYQPYWGYHRSFGYSNPRYGYYNNGYTYPYYYGYYYPYGNYGYYYYYR